MSNRRLNIAGRLDVPCLASAAKPLLLAMLAGCAMTAQAQRAKPGSGQRLQQAAISDVPRCSRRLGTLSIVDGDDPRPWTQYGLSPPSKLLKILVQRSGCFSIVDRASGLQSAELERNIGGRPGNQTRSNVRQGQIRAADYVMVAELQGANANASGSGAAIGGLMGLGLGGLLGGISSKKVEANTVLSVTNVRTTETVATQEGYAAKRDLSVSSEGVTAIGKAAGGGYDNTDIGRTVTLSFIQAYAKMVEGLALVRPGDAGAARLPLDKTEPPVANATRLQSELQSLAPGSAERTRPLFAQPTTVMRSDAGYNYRAVKTIPADATLRETGRRSGDWIEVVDGAGARGWIPVSARQ